MSHIDFLQTPPANDNAQAPRVTPSQAQPEAHVPAPTPRALVLVRPRRDRASVL